MLDYKHMRLKMRQYGIYISHLNYCNGLFMGLPESEISRLQRVQNAAARLVFNRRKYDSATEALKSLHWLKMRERILFNIMVIVYKITQGDAPRYLIDMFEYKVAKRSLRSSQDHLQFVIPITKRHTFADRSLSVFGPRHWNSLPLDIRNSDSLESFKNSLKTYLFKKCYNL